MILVTYLYRIDGLVEKRRQWLPAPTLRRSNQAMVSDFLNPTIFWEYDTTQIDPDQWGTFIVKQVFNRNIVTQTAAIPSLLEYYMKEQVEVMLCQEEWLTSVGIQTAQHYFSHFGRRNFRATDRINRGRRELAEVGEHNFKL